MRIETFTKKDRVYLTSKTYLSKVKTGCTVIVLLCLISSFASLAYFGITYGTIITFGVLSFVGYLGCKLLIRYSRVASVKGGNLILKSLGNKHQVAPVGSIKQVRSNDLFGVEFTRVRFKLDGNSDSFIIVSKAKSLRKKSPGRLLKEEIANSRSTKIEANHKPGPVLTQSA